MEKAAQVILDGYGVGLATERELKMHCCIGLVVGWRQGEGLYMHVQ